MYVVHIIYAKDYIHIWGHTNLWLYQKQLTCIQVVVLVASCSDSSWRRIAVRTLQNISSRAHKIPLLDVCPFLSSSGLVLR